MGIYIPDIEKPKKVDGIKIDFHFEDGHFESHIIGIEEIIEIVTCGECKWSKIYYVKADNSTRLCCDNYSGLDKDVDPSDFCPYGERRNDDNI
jgi:hypothetical protein